MSGVWQDLRFSLRGITRSPGSFLLAALTLAVGVALVTAVFTGVNSILFRSLGVEAPAELYRLKTQHIESQRTGSLIPYVDYLAYRDGGGAGLDFAASQVVVANLRDSSANSRVLCAVISSNYFAVLGVDPARGRDFEPADDVASSPPVAIVSHRLWRRIAKTDELAAVSISLNGHHFDVVGVAPAGFQGLDPVLRPEVWIPSKAVDRILGPTARSLFDTRNSFFFNVVARADAASIDTTRARVDAISESLASEFAENRDRRGKLVPLSDDSDWYGPAIFFLASGALLLMLVVCLNVTNLQLAKSSARQHEIAVRQSLGAGAWRVARLFLTESVLVGLAAGICGLFLASNARHIVALIDLPVTFSMAVPFQLDGRAFVFAVLVVVVTTATIGIAPVLARRRARVIDDLKGTAPTASRWLPTSRALVVFQVALSFVALVTAVVFTRGLSESLKTDLGFVADDVYVLSMEFDSSIDGMERTRRVTTDLLEQVRAMPRVEAAAVASHVPLWWEPSLGAGRVHARDGGPEARPFLTIQAVVGAGYFDTLGIPILRGRGFDSRDRSGSTPTAVVSDALAKRLWPDSDPLGQPLDFRGSPPGFGLLGSEGAVLEVVGVVADSSHLIVGQGNQSQVYVPISQNFRPTVVLHVRARGIQTELVGTLAEMIRARDADVAVPIALPLSDVVGRSLWAQRAGAAFSIFLAAVTVVFAGIGIFGLVACLVSQRVHEIGVRMALGATRHQIRNLVLGRGLGLTLLGLILGGVISFMLSRALGSLVSGVDPTSPAIYLLSASVLLTASLIAGYLPARRATTIPPATALRHERV